MGEIRDNAAATCPWMSALGNAGSDLAPKITGPVPAPPRPHTLGDLSHPDWWITCCHRRGPAKQETLQSPIRYIHPHLKFSACISARDWAIKGPTSLSRIVVVVSCVRRRHASEASCRDLNGREIASTTPAVPAMFQASALFRNLGRAVLQAFRTERIAPRARATTLSNMEAYSSTVVLSAEPRDMPQDGADKIHHVVKNGRLTGFKNPYPSWGEGNALAEMIRLVAW